MARKGEIDGLERARIIERLIIERGYICEKCGYKLSTKQNNPRQRQLHHIKELKYGGTYDDDNLQLLCLTCHRKHHGHIK